MKNTKKVFSVLLVMLMLLSVSIQAFAAPDTGLADGVADNIADCCAEDTEDASCCADFEDVTVKFQLQCTFGCGRFVPVGQPVAICVKGSCVLDWCLCYYAWA